MKPRKIRKRCPLTKIPRIICGVCGNTEEFIAVTERRCAGAVLSFHDNVASIDDSLGDDIDIDIFPLACAKCGGEMPIDAKHLVLPDRIEHICTQCANKFDCYTSREECQGFKFTIEPQVELKT